MARWGWEIETLMSRTVGGRSMPECTGTLVEQPVESLDDLREEWEK